MDLHYCFTDIGNSRIKFSYLDKLYSFEYKPLISNQLELFFSSIKVSKCFYSSVNIYSEKLLTEILRKYSIQAINADNLIQNLELDFSKISGTGTDRKFGIIGAYELSSAPVITIDCGTAVTINFLDSDGCFQGGAIFAGAYTQLNALSKRTQLKNFSLKFEQNKIGTNTADSINYGIYSSIIGGITNVLSNKYKNIPKYITGGYGEIIRKGLKEQYPELKYIPDLVIRGIKQTVYSLKA